MARVVKAKLGRNVVPVVDCINNKLYVRVIKTLGESNIW